MSERPSGVHVLGDMFHPQVQAGLPDGRCVAAVAEPYSANRLVAAWWVLTGRAYALKWPQAGDVETALGLAPIRRAALATTQETRPPASVQGRGA